MELSFGDWEGLTWREVEARDPAGAVAREAEKWNFKPPNGESYAELALRVEAWLNEVDGEIFVAGHGGTARAFLYLLAGVAPEVAASQEVWQGRALVFADGGYRWIG
jgi:broad specificity phosphatase PhoE